MGTRTHAKDEEATAQVTGSREVERVSVNVSSEVAAVIRRLAEKHGTTVTEIVRRAVLTEDYFDRALGEGYSIQLHKPGEPVREIVFR